MKKLHDYHQNKKVINLHKLTKEELYVFQVGLDKSLTFGLTEGTINWLAPMKDEVPPLDAMQKLVEALQETSNKSQKIKYLDDFGEQFGDIMHMAVTKTLRCGFSASTLNKVYPGLILEFKVQLGKTIPVEKLKFPVLVENKWDGIRCMIVVNTNGTRFYTRNGKRILTVQKPDWINALAQLDFGVYDGELIYGEGKVKDRTIVSGRANSGISGNAMLLDGVTFKVFDYLTLSEFDSKDCKTALLHRREKIKHLNGPISFSEGYICSDMDELNEKLEENFKAGYEGLMAKNYYSYYNFKRDNSWAKFKETKTADLVINGFNEGKGKYEGMVGSIICAGTVEGKYLYVNVSGLTDAQREPGHFKEGQTIEVAYNSVITDKSTGLHSLFLPRYKCTRFDK